MNVLIFGTKGYLSNSLLFDKKKNFKITLLPKSEVSRKKYLKKKFDVIIHSLGANKFESNKNASKTSTEKKKLTFKLLDFAERNNIKKIIYISSTNVYFKNKKLLNLRNPYSKAHILTEKTLKKKVSKNIKILILRISHLFGLRDTTKSKGKFLSIVNNFIKCLINKKDFVIRDKTAEINILPLSYLISRLDNLIKFKNNYKIIYISFLRIKIIPLLNIISNRISIKLSNKPHVCLKDSKYLNLDKIGISKKKITSKMKIFIKEVDETIDYFNKNYK